jgi:transcriptional regulator with XRE-family HTH domain
MHAYLHQSFNNFPIPVPAVGAWIRHRRLELGLSCAKAASLAGLSHRDWHMLEQGSVPNFDERLLRSIAATLEVTFDALDCAIEPLRSHFAGAGECPWNL